MIKVTFLTGEYPPMQGGIADHTAYLAQYLAPLGVEASILTSRRWQQTLTPAPSLSGRGMSRQRRGEGFSSSGACDTVVNVPPPSVYPVIPTWGWRCWPGVVNFIKTHRPDILHLQYQAAAFNLTGWVNWLPWYLRQRRLPVRIVTTFHDLRVPYIFPKAGAFRWRSMLALARYSHAIICTNREDLQALRHAFPQTPSSPRFASPLSSPTLIPLGSNVEPQPPVNFDRAAWRAQYQAVPNTFLLAYFGFLNESKGGEELIAALAQLRQQGLDARLLLIGGDIGHADPTNVAYAQKVQTLIDHHHLAEFVDRTGYVSLSEVSANLLAADAVVMPYRDGVSFRRTTLMAALQHGCPVVSTIPAAPDLVPEIRPGENMLLVPPGDPIALAESLARLAGDMALRQKLSQEARQLGGLFQWDKIAAATQDVYQTILYHAEDM